MSSDIFLVMIAVVWALIGAQIVRLVVTRYRSQVEGTPMTSVRSAQTTLSSRAFVSIDQWSLLGARQNAQGVVMFQAAPSLRGASACNCIDEALGILAEIDANALTGVHNVEQAESARPPLVVMPPVADTEVLTVNPTGLLVAEEPELQSALFDESGTISQACLSQSVPQVVENIEVDEPTEDTDTESGADTQADLVETERPLGELESEITDTDTDGLASQVETALQDDVDQTRDSADARTTSSLDDLVGEVTDSPLMAGQDSIVLNTRDHDGVYEQLADGYQRDASVPAVSAAADAILDGVHSGEEVSWRIDYRQRAQRRTVVLGTLAAGTAFTTVATLTFAPIMMWAAAACVLLTVTYLVLLRSARVAEVKLWENYAAYQASTEASEQRPRSAAYARTPATAVPVAIDDDDPIFDHLPYQPAEVDSYTTPVVRKAS